MTNQQSRILDGLSRLTTSLSMLPGVKVDPKSMSGLEKIFKGDVVIEYVKNGKGKAEKHESYRCSDAAIEQLREKIKSTSA